MDHARKMVVLPENNADNYQDLSRNTVPSITNIPINKDISDNQPAKSSQKKRKSYRQKNIEKLNFIIELALKFAKINGYDEKGRIIGKNGEVIQNSNIINLFEYSMKDGKLLVGEDEFVHLLYKAKIDPENITNINIKNKLLNLYSNKNSITTSEAFQEKTSDFPQRQQQIFRPHDTPSIRTSIKRKREIEDDRPDEIIEETPAKRLKNWIYDG